MQQSGKQVGLNNNPVTKAGPTKSETDNARQLPVELWALSMKKQIIDLRQNVPQLMKYVENKRYSTNDDLLEINKLICNYQEKFTKLEGMIKQPIRNTAVGSNTMKSFKHFIIETVKNPATTTDPFLDLMETLDFSEAASVSNLFARKCLRGNYISNKPSILSKAPPLFSHRSKNDNTQFLKFLDVCKNRVFRDNREYVFEKVKVSNSREPSVIMVEVKYYNSTIQPTPKRIHGEPQYLLKAVIKIQEGHFVDIVVGEAREVLYDEEELIESKYRVYRKMAKKIRNFGISSHFEKLGSQTEFINFNQYIQKYTKCFYSKCVFCRKHLHHFEPPVCLIASAESIQYSTFDVCHEFCLKYGS